MNAFEYLSNKQNLYLKNVSYAISVDSEKNEKEIQLQDDLQVEVHAGKGLDLLVTRTMSAVSTSETLLTVTMGSTLYFKKQEDSDKEAIDKIDWKEEFLHKPHVLNSMTARISLLISQITSSFGGVPIVTSPNFMKEE